MLQYDVQSCKTRAVNKGAQGGWRPSSKFFSLPLEIVLDVVL